MRYELTTGVERRRRWSDEQKLEILREVRANGAGVAAVARRHDITRQHIYQWRRELRRKGLLELEQAVLLPVEVADGHANHAHSGFSFDARIEIALGNGRMVRADANTPDAVWMRLIRIAEAA